jgi:two-component system, OmpR family, response regulator RpaA
MERLILVVDDDEDVAETIERSLRRVGHRVLVAHRGADALQLSRENHPDLVVLDIMMPGMNGVEVCRHIRANPELTHIPILFLTAKGEIGDKIDGFEAGADDYLTKPFDLRELDLRAKALLRRTQQGDEQPEADAVELGPLVLNCRTFQITTPQQTVLLTPVEFELLHFLMTNTGRVYSADQLLQQVWGYPPGIGMPDLVRVHIKNIREKIEPEARHPIYLKNILRRGYMIDVPK